VNLLSSVTVLLGVAAAVFAQLPYSWAHIVAVGIGAGIGGLHLPNVTGSNNPKEVAEGKNQ